MKISIPSLPNELWQSIIVYFPTLRDFMRLWSCSQLLQTRYPKLDASFWDAILQAFISTSSLASKTLALQMKVYASHIMKSSSCQSFRSIQHLFTRRLCTASGCLKPYEDWCNHAHACTFHPGSLGSTSMLTCCRALSFQSPGCCSAFHRGDCHRMIFSNRSPEELRNAKKPQQGSPVNRLTASTLPAITTAANATSSTKVAASTKNITRLPSIQSALG